VEDFHTVGVVMAKAQSLSLVRVCAVVAFLVVVDRRKFPL